MSLWGDDPTTTLNVSIITPTIKPDKNFMSKFIGIVDGDGYIEIGPQKQYNKSTNNLAKSTIRARLVIRLHERDETLLNHLTNVLGVGSISKLSSVNQIRLIFNKKDLTDIIIPLMNLYNLQFLTFNRAKQFTLLNYIITNRIVHWQDIEAFVAASSDDTVDSASINPSEILKSPPQWQTESLLKLDFFSDWVIGFTIAEGSFGIKSNGSAFYSIKQKGSNNYNIIKAICCLITKKEPKPIKPDSADCYQLTLTSKLDIQLVLDFFSATGNSLYGYKFEQYKLWVEKLKISNRYENLKFPI